MFFILLVIVGLVLLLVSPPLFAAAATVGWILIGVAAAILALQLAVMALAVKAQSSIRKRFDRF